MFYFPQRLIVMAEDGKLSPAASKAKATDNFLLLLRLLLRIMALLVQSLRKSDLPGLMSVRDIKVVLCCL